MPDSPFCMFHSRTYLDDRAKRSGTRSERKLLRAATHPESRKESIGLYRLLAAGWFVLLACSAAFADSITFTSTIGGRSQSAEVTILLRGTVNYISLSDLVTGFGGKTTVQPDRIQVDLSDGQAWLKPDETSVNSTFDSFELRQPVLREGNTILVSVTDVQPLLMKAFGTTATQRVSRTSSEDMSDAADVPSLVDSPPPTAPRQPSGSRTEIRTVIVDPGHGGSDAGFEPTGGAIIGASGTKEKDITLAVALKVREALERQLGLQVRLTRDEDLMLPDKQRVMLANRDRGDILISLHMGASQTPSATGFEFFHSGYDAGLNAAEIARLISDTLVETSGTGSRGVRKARLSLFRELEMPGILIELGFLTNQADTALLVDDAYQQKMAEGIAAGLAPFVKTRAAETP